MGTAMRGYSLIAVLVAMMILMAVLLPLMTLQGRLFEYTADDEIFEIIQAIEQDMENLSPGKEVQPRELMLEQHRIVLSVAPAGDSLYRIDYRVHSKISGEELFTVTRYLFRPI